VYLAGLTGEYGHFKWFIGVRHCAGCRRQQKKGGEEQEQDGNTGVFWVLHTIHLYTRLVPGRKKVSPFPGCRIPGWVWRGNPVYLLAEVHYSRGRVWEWKRGR
jgi:hypothetical protein